MQTKRLSHQAESILKTCGIIDCSDEEGLPVEAVLYAVDDFTSFMNIN